MVWGPATCTQAPCRTQTCYIRVLTWGLNELPGQSLCTPSSKDPPALNQLHVAQSKTFIQGVLTPLFKEKEQSSENSLPHDADDPPRSYRLCPWRAGPRRLLPEAAPLISPFSWSPLCPPFWSDVISPSEPRAELTQSHVILRHLCI